MPVPIDRTLVQLLQIIMGSEGTRFINILKKLYISLRHLLEVDEPNVPSTRELSEISSWGLPCSLKSTEVMVSSPCKVNDRLPAAGRFKAVSRLPQYFTRAMLVPVRAVQIIRGFQFRWRTR